LYFALRPDPDCENIVLGWRGGIDKVTLIGAVQSAVIQRSPMTGYVGQIRCDRNPHGDTVLQHNNLACGNLLIDPPLPGEEKVTLLGNA
jgi:hypothetical protein